ncbi:hypothetical protein N44_00589 [Microcystis aeruginosa NIES-44]|uniref:Uncharacterized protein n=1 Tax=Microcystis aeruginosa NIES-44 TaxID=449439 RepID=A0A0A1VNN1_MICAE|nr:hypothetical protein N44_00589 [Microcystis aeruginosa NIES-44]
MAQNRIVIMIIYHLPSTNSKKPRLTFPIAALCETIDRVLS